MSRSLLSRVVAGTTIVTVLAFVTSTRNSAPTPISTVQGSDNKSPLENHIVIVEVIVMRDQGHAGLAGQLHEDFG
ncbi:MAG TPA: hypothetical protein VF600_19005 [Abditibacteriaceae bacterium]